MTNYDVINGIIVLIEERSCKNKTGLGSIAQNIPKDGDVGSELCPVLRFIFGGTVEETFS